MSHYISRVLVSRGARLKAKDQRWSFPPGRAGQAEMDHALIWTLFPGDGAARDFIFRREGPRGRDWEASYLVVSARSPLENELLSVVCKPFAPQLAVGERLRFDLRANPVVSRRKEGKLQRHDVLMDVKKHAAGEDDLKEQIDAAAVDWLLKRGRHWGLAIQPETVRLDGYAQQTLPAKGRTAGFSILDYSGLATVTDAVKLRRALTEGVGHAKSYGCGLLLVRRLR